MNTEYFIDISFTDGKRSEKFKVKVKVDQGSILNSLLFAIVMDEIAKDVREGGVKELVYADDFVMLGDSWLEVKMI